MTIFSFTYSIPYLTVFFVLLFQFLVSIEPYSNRELKKSSKPLANYVTTLTLLFFFGFRGFIATDWQNYVKLYDSLPTFRNDFDDVIGFMKHFPWEKGFGLYSICLKSISENYFFYQFVSYFIDFLLLYKCLKLYIGKNYEIGFIFYFLFGALTINVDLLRNSKSIFLFIISLKYIYEKKLIKFFCLNLLGFFFHSTTIFYFPMYFVLNRKYKDRHVISIFTIGLIIYLFRIEWMKGILLNIMSLFGSHFAMMAKVYLNSKNDAASYGISIGFLERFLTFCLVFKFRNKLLEKQQFNLILINSLFLYVYIQFFMSEMKVVIDRVPLLFIYSYWFLYPQIYTLLSKKNKILFILMLLFYGSLKMVMVNNIQMRYDNVLLGYQSYSERKEIIGRVSQTLLKRLLK